MCGIIGFNFKSNKNKIFKVTNHRGPDNTGVLVKSWSLIK
jgi:asparagine synthase (glutamine-hydrolysing)